MKQAVIELNHKIRFILENFTEQTMKTSGRYTSLVESNYVSIIDSVQYTPVVFSMGVIIYIYIGVICHVSGNNEAVSYKHF